VAARRRDPAAGGRLTRTSAVDTLALLVGTPSVNPALSADATAGEARVATVIIDWCARHGIDAWLEEVAPGRPNVIARVGTGAAPVLVLCGHTDTVSAAGMRVPPFEPRVADGRLYGRGSYDMKGGVAAVLCALAELAADPPAGTVLGALVVDEEFASAGAFDFAARHRADACILTEPSEERLVVAHKGFVWLEVETRGVAAHGSRWELGRSAVADMGRVIVALSAHDRDVLRRRTHPLTGPASVHCSMISGGEGWSTYAAHCTLRVERRTIPGESADDVVAEIRQLIHDSGIADARVEVVLQRAPLEVDAAARVTRCVRAAAEHVLGHEPETCGVAYWMDAAVFAAAGMPTVNYGPAGAGAHAAEEWVDIASVERTADVLVRAARAFCADTRQRGDEEQRSRTPEQPDARPD
jgi:acetylornithine deacetylase